MGWKKNHMAVPQTTSLHMHMLCFCSGSGSYLNIHDIDWRRVCCSWILKCRSIITTRAELRNRWSVFIDWNVFMSRKLSGCCGLLCGCGWSFLEHMIYWHLVGKKKDILKHNQLVVFSQVLGMLVTMTTFFIPVIIF